MEEHLSTRQVAAALNVSESSVKRWCNRGVIPTVRTVGGHRRIPLAGFMEFLDQTNREVITPLPGVTSHSPSSPDENIDDLRATFETALKEGDEQTCRQVLTRWYSRKDSFSLLADEFIAAAFHSLGELWDCGELEVYQERRGCEICSRILHEFRRLIPAAPSNAPLALGGSPEGDQYSLPSQLIELVLRESSWQTMNLGPNLPLTSIAAAVEKHRPRLLWLSVSHLESRDDFVRDYRQLTDTLPEDIMIVLGGRALTDDIRPKLKYTGHCDNLQQLAAFANALHGRRHSIHTSMN